jgi:hypothetical protein
MTDGKSLRSFSLSIGSALVLLLCGVSCDKSGAVEDDRRAPPAAAKGPSRAPVTASDAGTPVTSPPPDAAAPAIVVIATDTTDASNARPFPKVVMPPAGFVELGSTAARATPIRETMDLSSKRIGTLDRKGLRGSTGECEWRFWWVDHEEYANRPRCGDVVEIQEDNEAIPVYGVIQAKDGARAFRIIAGADASEGWISSGAPFHTLEALITDKDKLTYLTHHWDKKLYSKPDGKARTLRSKRTEHTYEPLEHRWVGDLLWIRVKVITTLCDDDKEQTLGTGWVRAFRDDGSLVAWFYSRGC